VSPVQAAENYAVGVCRTATRSEGAEISPTYAADDYLAESHGDDPRYKAKLDSGQFFSNAKVTLLKAPEHGNVSLVDTPISNEWYHYMPNNGYVGRDHFVMQVDKEGVKVRIEYLIEGIDDEEAKVRFCEQESWKISVNTSSPDNVLANAVSDTITIDTSGAGYDWYIDYTPYLNDKYESTYPVVAIFPHIKSIT
jgi:hypothetical protein